MNNDVIGYQLVHGSDSGDFAVKIFVRRPAEVMNAIAKLDDVSKHGELTPKERANCLFLKVGTEINNILHLQAAQLDPKTPERKQETKAAFKKAFAAAGFNSIFMQEIPNEYCGTDEVEALSNPWYIITTSIGHIKVGWSRHAIRLDWSQTTIKKSTEEIFPGEGSRYDDKAVHPFGYERLSACLEVLFLHGLVP